MGHGLLAETKFHYDFSMLRMGRPYLFQLCLASALALALIVLGVLEYRWAGIVSEADHDRMQTRLHTAISEIQGQFNAEMEDLCVALRPPLPGSASEGVTYAERLLSWQRKARHPAIVRQVYVFAVGAGRHEVLRWDPARQTLRNADLPSYLASIARELLILSFPIAASPFTLASGQRTPLLVHSSAAGKERRLVIAELDADAFAQGVFPDIIRRYLGDDHFTDFQIGVLDSQNKRALVYPPDNDLSPSLFRGGDASVVLWEQQRAPAALAARALVWTLVAKHREGSLAAAAIEVRRRWLVINFAVLIVLALGLATVVMSILRAQAFLRLQMEFVAGVSHELRTPLSVIGSAADNLAEGVVRSEKDVQEYGSLIRTECRRLSRLVEQTLRFSAGKADVRPRDIQFLCIPDVIDRALNAAATAGDSTRFQIEKIVDANLPLVRSDPDLLSECLLNLISNALKYGAEREWLGIRAQSVETGHGTGVQITVEDRGIGIPPSELPHIFEPFYRGQTARATLIRGTGLGLSLAREAAASIGARISVTSVVGEGSAFTLHIPPAYMNSSTVPVEALVES